MKTYISGPITAEVPGTTREGRKQLFYEAAAQLTDPVNPLNVGACPLADCGPNDGHTWQCWLKYDLLAMLECDAILLLPHWELSPGARLEFFVATQVGMKVLYYEELG